MHPTTLTNCSSEYTSMLQLEACDGPGIADACAMITGGLVDCLRKRKRIYNVSFFSLTAKSFRLKVKKIK